MKGWGELFGYPSPFVCACTAAFLFPLCILLGIIVSPAAAARGDVELQASILRARPAVVLISSEVAADVTVHCGPGPAKTVRPEPLYETGSGFIIHPDGYIATNGHVVERFHELNEQRLVADFLKAGTAEACGPNRNGGA